MAVSMKIKMKKTAVLLLLLALSRPAFADASGEADKGPVTLQEIAGSIDAWRGRTVTMSLRLKHYDRIFEKVIFYDGNNHDIEFSIEKKKLTPELKKNLVNLHEGLTYRVRFRVVTVGALGLVTGELVSFTPLVLDKIPVGLINKRRQNSWAAILPSVNAVPSNEYDSIGRETSYYHLYVQDRTSIVNTLINF